MVDYLGLDSLLNTASDMSEIVGSRQDDTTNTVSGVPWFKVNGVTANTLYFSSNSWVNFSANNESSNVLKIFRRDGSMYKLYRQVGTLWHGYYDFLKLRFDGYTYYNGETSAHRLVYEIFLISNGQLMINIQVSPSADDRGTNQFIADSVISLPVNLGGSYQFILTPADTENGREWTLSEEELHVDEPYATGYLIQDGSGNTYTVVNNSLQEISGGLTAQNFLDYGVEDFDSRLLLGLNSPKVVFWHDSEDALPTLKLKVNAVPLVPQKVVFKNIEANLSVKYLTITSDDETLYNVSFDNGSTWKYWNNGSWTNVPNDGIGNTKRDLERLSATAWQGITDVRFRAWIFNQGRFQSIRLDYND